MRQHNLKWQVGVPSHLISASASASVSLCCRMISVHKSQMIAAAAAAATGAKKKGKGMKCGMEHVMAGALLAFYCIGWQWREN